MVVNLIITCLFLVSSVTSSDGLAPVSRADSSLIYEVDVNRLLDDGYILYSEPGKDRVLGLFLGRFGPFYQVDIFDLSSKQRVGFIDFNINKSEERGTSSGLTTALIVFMPRIYEERARSAARDFGLDLSIDESHEIRKSAPVDPPPAIYVKREYTRQGKLGWRHLSDILMGISFYVSDREGAQRMGISAEVGLAERLFYERRYGALPHKGWYQDIYPGVYGKLGRVQMGGMVFDFTEGRFFPAPKGVKFPTPLDVFVDSIPEFTDSDALKIDRQTKEAGFPDRHVWSFLRAVAQFMGEQGGRELLRQWVASSLASRGREPVEVPLSFMDFPEDWRPILHLLIDKRIVRIPVQPHELGDYLKGSKTGPAPEALPAADPSRLAERSA